MEKAKQEGMPVSNSLNIVLPRYSSLQTPVRINSPRTTLGGSNNITNQSLSYAQQSFSRLIPNYATSSQMRAYTPHIPSAYFPRASDERNSFVNVSGVGFGAGAGAGALNNTQHVSGVGAYGRTVQNQQKIGPRAQYFTWEIPRKIDAGLQTLQEAVAAAEVETAKAAGSNNSIGAMPKGPDGKRNFEVPNNARIGHHNVYTLGDHYGHSHMTNQQANVPIRPYTSHSGAGYPNIPYAGMDSQRASLAKTSAPSRYLHQNISHQQMAQQGAVAKRAASTAGVKIENMGDTQKRKFTKVKPEIEGHRKKRKVPAKRLEPPSPNVSGWSASQHKRALRSSPPMTAESSGGISRQGKKESKSRSGKEAGANADAKTLGLLRKRVEMARAAAEISNSGGYCWPTLDDPSSLAQPWESDLIRHLELILENELGEGPHADSIEVVGKISLLRFLRGCNHNVFRAANKFREHLIVRKYFGMDDVRKSLIQNQQSLLLHCVKKRLTESGNGKQKKSSYLQSALAVTEALKSARKTPESRISTILHEDPYSRIKPKKHSEVSVKANSSPGTHSTGVSADSHDNGEIQAQKHSRDEKIAGAKDAQEESVSAMDDMNTLFNLPIMYKQSDLYAGGTIGAYCPCSPNAGHDLKTADPVSVQLYTGLISRVAQVHGIDIFLTHMVESFVRRQIQLDVLSRQRKRLVSEVILANSTPAGLWELLTPGAPRDLFRIKMQIQDTFPESISRIDWIGIDSTWSLRHFRERIVRLYPRHLRSKIMLHRKGNMWKTLKSSMSLSITRVMRRLINQFANSTMAGDASTSPSTLSESKSDAHGDGSGQTGAAQVDNDSGPSGSNSECTLEKVKIYSDACQGHHFMHNKSFLCGFVTLDLERGIYELPIEVDAAKVASVSYQFMVYENGSTEFKELETRCASLEHLTKTDLFPGAKSSVTRSATGTGMKDRGDDTAVGKKNNPPVPQLRRSSRGQIARFGRGNPAELDMKSMSSLQANGEQRASNNNNSTYEHGQSDLPKSKFMISVVRKKLAEDKEADDEEDVDTLEISDYGQLGYAQRVRLIRKREQMQQTAGVLPWESMPTSSSFQHESSHVNSQVDKRSDSGVFPIWAGGERLGAIELTCAERDELEYERQTTYRISAGKPPLREVVFRERQLLHQQCESIILSESPRFFPDKALIRLQWSAASDQGEHDGKFGMANNAAGSPDTDAVQMTIVSNMNAKPKSTPYINDVVPASLFDGAKCNGVHLIYCVEIHSKENMADLN